MDERWYGYALGLGTIKELSIGLRLSVVELETARDRRTDRQTDRFQCVIVLL